MLLLPHCAARGADARRESNVKASSHVGSPLALRPSCCKLLSCPPSVPTCLCTDGHPNIVFHINKDSRYNKCIHPIPGLI